MFHQGCEWCLFYDINFNNRSSNGINKRKNTIIKKRELSGNAEADSISKTDNNSK